MTSPNGTPQTDSGTSRVPRKKTVFAVAAAAALILACVLAGGIVSLKNSSAGHPSTFGADGYVRSATYFGDAWHINFWNSEMEHLERDMKQIREDGFDSVILAIPWKEFQPGVEPVAYSDYAFDQLDRVMNAAGADLRAGRVFDRSDQRLISVRRIRSSWQSLNTSTKYAEKPATRTTRSL